MKKTAMRRGFTLLELSIVMVIIGLIVGGILVGQSLIRASELQSVLKDINQYRVATNNFRDKYNGIPGDLPNATQYWGAAPACPAAGTGTQTCNGNGDGKVSMGMYNSTSFTEMFRYWQQLGISGMLQGNFTGVAGSGSASHFVGGENTPISQLDGGVYSIFNGTTNVLSSNFSATGFFTGMYGNFLSLGKQTTSGHPWDGLITGADALSLDRKADDGLPGNGAIVSNTDSNCATTTDPSTAIYVLDSASTSCFLHFRNLF